MQIAGHLSFRAGIRVRGNKRRNRKGWGSCNSSYLFKSSSVRSRNIIKKNYQKHRKLTCQRSRPGVFCNTLKPANLKKRLWYRCFPVNLLKFLITFFIEHFQWLLLYCPILKKNCLQNIVKTLLKVEHLFVYFLVFFFLWTC